MPFTALLEFREGRGGVGSFQFEILSACGDHGLPAVFVVGAHLDGLALGPLCVFLTHLPLWGCSQPWALIQRPGHIFSSKTWGIQSAEKAAYS